MLKHHDKLIFVYGSSIHSYLVAIIVVDVALLRKYHTATPVQQVKESAEPICLLDDRSVRERFLLDLREFGANRGLTGIEQIRNAHLTEEEFTADSGLLTPTLKVKRSLLISRYAKIFEKLYAEELY
ncbi:unnamed protein product [Anisakis simplex]|uniref:Long-chain-fatty-acid--CoA ligase n=1 Tax=Anisakis simplex TaxID=6269 RepID=A0A0M3J4C8_ANISI|nr:unnamed protein product [Anisakis simplex]